MADQSFVVGIDFGTLSGRAVVVRVADGAELGSATHAYAHGVVTDTLPATGASLPPEWALQVPEDYREVLRVAVPAAIRDAGVAPDEVVGIGIDFTSCTMIPTLRDGTPLCELDEYTERPHAYAKLWKHHAAQPQADLINERARGTALLARYGGLVSSEWQLPKALQVFYEDRPLFDAMDCWVEAGDWIVGQLCGVYLRNACAAGYKGNLQDGAYPSVGFLAGIAPGFERLVTEKLTHPLAQLGERAGSLSAQASSWTGLPEGIAVAVAGVDAHVTAPAARVTEPGQMVMIMGTSTCQLVVSDVLAEVPGISGVVDGGIVAGRWGYEAGQSAVGDIFAWFTDHFVPPAYVEEAEHAGQNLHEYLSTLAADQQVGEHGLIALDWWGGNRSVLVDHQLSGLILGMTLATRPEHIYRALLEATAFGTRVILEAYRAGGIGINEVVVAGGLAKNPVLMQIYADVTRLRLKVIGSEQGAALGSAIHAAVAAGVHPNVTAAARVMGKVSEVVYEPDAARARAYDRLFAEYQALHDHFGRGEGLMRRLRGLRSGH